MEAFSVLEQLPFPVVKVIARYCSPQDIAVCCAVSSQMRDIFGESILWRRHCTSGLAEYLRSTPCKVQPAFVSPEPENSTLSPISSARLDFMLENHLWNNWRLGRNVRQEIQKESETHFRFSIWDQFLTNDHVMSHMDSPKRIEIFDVRKSPLQDLAILVSPNNIYDEIRILNNRVCLIKNQCVEVHIASIDLDTQQSPLSTVEHVFFYDNEVKKENANSSLSITAGDKGTTLLIGSLLVGIKKRDATLHIWNIETGFKVKMQECPLSCGFFEQVRVADMKLVLKVTDNLRTTNPICTILVYDLRTLRYEAFKLNVNPPFEYQVCSRFLAILSKKLLNVFDYKTSETVMSDVHVDSDVLASFQNSFIFIENNEIKACDPVLRQIVKLPMNDKVRSFEILSDRFLQVTTYHRYQLILWEFQGLRKSRRIRTKLDFVVTAYYLNKASTRYIVRYGSHGTLIHFW